MLIVLDAGHGKNTLGKRCMKALDPQQTREWTLNSRIAEKVEAQLKTYHCDVLRVDDRTGVKDVSLANRVKASNNANATAYISIHHNAGINGGTGGGIVVYVAKTCSQTSKNLQKSVYNAMVKKTGLKGNRSEPLQAYNYYVVKNVKAPAILIECGFMDSSTDTPTILTEAFAQKAADGIVEGLVDVLKIKNKKNPEPEPVTVTIKLPALRKGDAGASVTAMQQLLTAKSYSTKGIDGKFGANTDRALRDYKEDNDLSADGVCDQETWSALLTK